MSFEKPVQLWGFEVSLIKGDPMRPRPSDVISVCALISDKETAPTGWRRLPGDDRRVWTIVMRAELLEWEVWV